MNEIEKFKTEVTENIKGLGADSSLQSISRKWVEAVSPHKWAYNFTWMGRPAIQFPNDAWAVQEIIWETRPDLIIEAGIAHGGSLIFSASMLALLDLSDAIESGKPLDPSVSTRKVLGIDVDIRSHNRKEIESHPMFSRIEMIEGSSIESSIIDQVKGIASGYSHVMVLLDSNHTHEHVLKELLGYANLTSPGCYCCVFDTLIEDMPNHLFPDRPWGPGNNPKTAVHEFLKSNDNFVIDSDIHNKLSITVAPDGFLKRIA